ncbi:MarR [Desulforapulum autotrophicum HRM2]|uniref:MarR n=1 Tax=Desulforapulum autotrophicum (strain ATCC 43914 / DSM 3382 / VKM B-1955 / HRM2) TaxID=177437 RepID=C0QDU6_DESAH|nr:MarR family transcriptional regulator [Desulforapulum autotrophicum]ACN17367.1 MarR [Desulforapulum autotrophicum HRM2]
MPGFDPLESIGFHCNLTFKSFSASLEQRLGGSGVSRVQFMALAHLIALGTMPQKDLAQLLSITSASTVRLVDRLTRDGWAERIPAQDDRRVKLIVPTPKAVEAWEVMSDHAEKITAKAYVGLTREEIDGVKAVLKKVRENLKKI